MSGSGVASGSADRRVNTTRSWTVQKGYIRSSALLDNSGNIDIRPLALIFTLCAVAYIGIYAFEAPLRYALYVSGKDNLILLRDGLIIGPLVLLFAAQAIRLQIHPLFWSAGTLLTFHGLVLMGTIGSITAVAYATKVLANLLFGFFAASLLVSPGKKMLAFLIAIWCITILGLCLDKFLLTFPWTGIKTIVGDLNVDVSKDWQIQDTLARRVAGFTRSSIAAAVLIPSLAIVMMSRIRNRLLRVFVGATSLAAVALTTQKGSFFALAPLAAIQCLPSSFRLTLLRLCCVTFMIAAVSMPFLTFGLFIPHGTGVFSAESMYLRIAYTWPQAWHWIVHHQMLIFGVGLGGIGGPQRIYALDSFNPADNIFILMYAYFGVFAVLYLLIVCFLVLRPVTGSKDRTATAVALLAFAFGYGTFLSIIEDQAAALFLGAALGVLWYETRRTVPVSVSAAPSATPWATQGGSIGN
jgi:hypothetical protein